jgi:hypothetical protein
MLCCIQEAGKCQISVLHDFDHTQRRKGRKGRFSFAFLASLRANRELLNLASSGKALFSAASATTISAPLVRLQSASLQVLLPLWGVALGWFSRAGVQAEAWPLVLYAPCASCGIIASSAAQHLDNRIASWSAVAGRPFCGRPEELPDSYPCAGTGQLPHETASEGAVAARPRRLQPQQKAIPAQAAGHSGPVRAETVG